MYQNTKNVEGIYLLNTSKSRTSNPGGVVPSIRVCAAIKGIVSVQSGQEKGIHSV